MAGNCNKKLISHEVDVFAFAILIKRTAKANTKENKNWSTWMLYKNGAKAMKEQETSKAWLALIQEMQ